MDTFTLMIEAVILIVVVALLAMAIKIANQWERAVVLFLGRFVGIKGPGIFLIVPFLSQCCVPDRSPGYHHIVQCRADPDERYRSGQC